jgi:preprotein translocase subunit SecF
MQLLNMKETIKFMSLKKPAAILSVFLIIGSLTSLAINQLNWGLANSQTARSIRF